MRFRCSLCGSECEAVPQAWCCHCGAPFVLEYAAKLDVEAARRGPRGIWRWQGGLPFIAEGHRILLGEGDTPLVSARWAGVPVQFKVESANPTGSFKDRGVAVLASWLRSMGVPRVTEDSSGNAGASLAAYCGRVGIERLAFTSRAEGSPSAVTTRFPEHLRPRCPPRRTRTEIHRQSRPLAR